MTKSNKVVVQLRGGLGNQLFGLFAGLKLAETHECRLVLDGRLIKFGSNKSRKLEINGLDLTGIQTQIDIRKAFPLPKSRLGQKVLRPFQNKIANYLMRNSPKNVVTDSSGFIESKEMESDVLLDGYFSTFSYFQAWFQNNPNFTFQPVSVTKRFSSTANMLHKLTGLHIRLGDYLNHPDIYPIPSSDYYKKGIELLDHNHGYVVFCENIEETSEHFPEIIRNAKLIVSSKDFNTTETLCLMASCKNLITANSTYSQWAGVFVKMKNGTVVYPSKFLLKSENNADVNDWIQLDIDTGDVI